MKNLYIIFVFIFIFAILSIVRYGFILFKKVKDKLNETEEVYNEGYGPDEDKKDFSQRELIYIGICISYVLSYILWLFI